MFTAATLPPIGALGAKSSALLKPFTAVAGGTVRWLSGSGGVAAGDGRHDLRAGYQTHEMPPYSDRPLPGLNERTPSVRALPTGSTVAA